MAWSPDGQTLPSGAADKTVRLWEVASRAAGLRVLEGHTDERLERGVESGRPARASPGRDDQTVRLWEVETGRCLRVLEGHTD